MNYTDEQKEILKGFGLTDSEITELETSGIEFTDAESKFKEAKTKADADATEAIKKAELDDKAKVISDRIVNDAIESKAKLDLTRKAVIGRLDKGSRPEIIEKAIAIGLTDQDLTAHADYGKSVTGRSFTDSDKAAIAIFGAQAKALATGDVAKAKEIDRVNKHQEWNSLNYGGYAMGVEYLPILIEARDHVGPLRSLITTINVSRNSGYWMLESSIGSVAWGAPAGTKHASRVKGSRVAFNLNECSSILIADDFLLEMSIIDYGSYLTRALARSFAIDEWNQFITGDGVYEPTGLATAAITQTANAGAAFTFDDINAGYFALPSEYRNNAVWILRDNNVESIHNLQDSQLRPLLSEIVTSGNPVPTIKGKPYYVNNNIAQNTAATPKNTVYFLDPSFYYIFQSNDMRFDTTNTATVTDASGSTINLWQENKTAFKAWYYADGNLADVRAAATLTNVP